MATYEDPERASSHKDMESTVTHEKMSSKKQTENWLSDLHIEQKARRPLWKQVGEAGTQSHRQPHSRRKDGCTGGRELKTGSVSPRSNSPRSKGLEPHMGQAYLLKPAPEK